MKISVTSIEDLGLDKVFVGGGTCPHCFQFGVFSEFILHFELTMSNGEAIKVSTDGVIQTDDTDVERALDNISVNVLKFSHDIKRTTDKLGLLLEHWGRTDASLIRFYPPSKAARFNRYDIRPE